MEQLSKIQFPVYKLGSYKKIDKNILGPITITTRYNKYLLDDVSLPYNTLAMRRLMAKSKYPWYSFKATLFSLRELFAEKSGTKFIDSTGALFTYKKGSRRYSVISKLITSKERLHAGGLLIIVKDMPSIYKVAFNRNNWESDYASMVITDMGPLLYDLTRDTHDPYKRAI